VADAVGHDQEVVLSVKGLTRAEELPGELRAQESLPAAARTVKQQHGVHRAASGVMEQRAKRRVAQAQRRQHAALSEADASQHELAGDGLG